MLFTSYDFLFAFLPISWALYMLLRFTALRPVMLTLSGYIFYAWGRPWIAILLFVSSTADFFIGLSLSRTEGHKARRWLLVISLIFNLGLLGTFKYSGWLFAGINRLLPLLHPSFQLPVLDIPIPAGISFYTFQSLAYIIDIYRRKIHAHKRLWDYWSFVAFFPQLFAGPIERAGQLLPQLTHPRKSIHPRMIETGIFMILWGLFKKLVVADNMDNLVELCKANMGLAGAGTVLALAFTFQIYADFSGYTDIARGCAKLFGINLRRNFLTPYFARSPSEFWQRWHISLSSWIRDYLYVSVGGSRFGVVRTFINLLITMMLAGLWHGAGTFFIAWGFYHGVLLILYRFISIDTWLERAFGMLGKWIATIVMFSFVVIGWVLFFVGEHGHLRKTFFPEDPPVSTVHITNLLYGLLLFALPLIITDSLAYRKGREFSDLWPHFSTVTKTAVLLLAFYSIVFFGARGGHPFIYFQF